MTYTYGVIDLKNAEYHLPGGQILKGPRQALGSLYKEFIIEDRVFCFYLQGSDKSTFVYKYFRERGIEFWDRNLPCLLRLVD